MAASEHTPHMRLSQFGTDDRPSWIDDYNADMRIIDTALGDGNQAVTDMTNEITAIKNKLDTSNTVFNYFNWSGTDWDISLKPVGEQDDSAIIPITNWEIKSVSEQDDSAIISITNPSVTGGIGDNNVISAIDGAAIQINQEGTYLIWSTINISAFSPNRGNLTTALSLAYIQAPNTEDPAALNIIHGGFITPVKAENTAPKQMAQSLSLQPTAVRLRAGACFMLMLKTGGNDTTPDAPVIHANIMESRTGIVKIR